jgi:arylamine N-acetyltransferase
VIFRNEDKGIELFFSHFIKEWSKDREQQLLKKVFLAFSNIPYENLTKHNYIKEKFASPFDIMRGYLEFGTGGTCFPLTYFLKRVLDFLGFNSYIVLADRTYAPSSHCVVITQIRDKLYLGDIGFSIFFPVDISQSKIRVKTVQGELEFLWSNDGKRIDVFTIFENGHRKFRYSVKLEKISFDDFLSAWEKTFEFEMMNHIVVVKLLKDKLIYLRDNFVHIIKDGVSKNIKLDSIFELENFVEKIGIKKEVFKKVCAKLGYGSSERT